MAEEKPLPRPPRTPFGRQRRADETEDEVSLLADRLAMAMASGKLEEFIEKELPGGEQGRRLAEMMLGMTGMAPMASSPEEGDMEQRESGGPQENAAPAGPPDELVEAARTGDLDRVMDELRREHARRHPGEEESGAGGKAVTAGEGLSAEEKEVIDDLMRIASENRLSIDWLILRALRTYVQEYRRTGRL